MAYVSKINGYDVKDKEAREQIGNLDLLNTSNTGNVVEAINSLDGKHNADYNTLEKSINDLSNEMGSIDELSFVEFPNGTGSLAEAMNELDVLTFKKENFLVFERTVTVEVEGLQPLELINLPAGYSVDNCVVISKSYSRPNPIANSYYTYGKLSDPEFAANSVVGAEPGITDYLNLMTEDMTVSIYNPSETPGETLMAVQINELASLPVGTEYSYKVVLLRYKD